MSQKIDDFQKNLYIQSSPNSASVNWDLVEDTKETRVAWFEEFNKLPLAIRLGLCDEEVSSGIEKISQSLGFVQDLGKVGEISRLVREIFTQGLKEMDILTRIKEKINLAGQERQKLYQEIKRLALVARIQGQKDFNAEFERWPIVKILSDYPEIRLQRANQAVLSLGEEEIPASPTVENWLKDYVLRTSSKRHNSVERSRYLFESENTKKLDSTERENLAILLKSYDEGFPLVVNKIERKLNLTESRKIDESWLASLEFFLGKISPASNERAFQPINRSERSIDQPNVFMKEAKKSDNLVQSSKKTVPPGLKNVLDLSELI